MGIVVALTDYLAVNPVPYCKAYYAYTTLYEYWVVKLGLLNTLATDKGTEFNNYDFITLYLLYNYRHRSRISHAQLAGQLKTRTAHSKNIDDALITEMKKK